jgi:hypothetical protein
VSWRTWQVMGLADVACHVIKRHLTPETKVQSALQRTWLDIDLANIACHFIGLSKSRETRD